MIVHDLDVMGGEPTIRGTRVSVSCIVIAFERYGSIEGVNRSYPTLPPGAAEAALDYYANHRDEIEAYIADDVTVASGRAEG